MEKLKLHTPDLTEENVEKLAAIFPNCVTEGRDEQGRLRRVVDFDLLRPARLGHSALPRLRTAADLHLQRRGRRQREHARWPGRRHQRRELRLR